MGIPPKRDKDNVVRNEGWFCTYCVRVWQSRFKHSYTLSTLVSKIGSGAEADRVIKERFDKLLSACIDACTAAGTRDVKISWAAIEPPGVFLRNA